MPVYEDAKCKNKDKRFYFQFYTGEIVNGVRKKITRRGFKSEKLADREMAALMTSYFKGEYVEPNKTLFKDYLKEWLKNKRKLSSETVELYESYFRLYINPALGGIPLIKINAQHIESFLTGLQDKGLAENTIKRVFSVVNAALNAAAIKDLVLKNVANKVEKPQAPKRRDMVVWEPEFVSEFLNQTREESRYWIAIYLAIMTGMRQGEILGVRWSDIDFNTRSIHIQQTVTRKRKIKPGAKNKSSVRSVAISPETVETLKEHRKSVLQEKLKCKDYENHDLAVCTSFGGPVTSRSIQKVWTRLIEKYKAPKITFYDLRHTHVALLIKQGIHIKVISERVGHSSVAITMDLYGHLMKNMQGEAADGLDTLLKYKIKSVK